MKRLTVASILLLGLAFVASAAPSWVDNELIVQFKRGTGQATIDQVTQNLGTEIVRNFRTGALHLRSRRAVSVPALVAKFAGHQAIEYAEPNYLFYSTATPNDPSFGQLWGLNNTGQTGGLSDADIDAPEAWDVTTGSSNIVVGIIDSGIDYNHPDLAANMWTNTGEIPGNNIDDDGNGYIDDVHGYDFVNNDADPMDDHGHGTHVAGTVGAVGNDSVGVAGVNWSVSLMALKAGTASGSLPTSAIIAAVEYATDMGAHVTNNSYSGSFQGRALADAIRTSRLFVAASGNDGARTPRFPAALPLDNIISVAATDHNDQLASFSNRGRRWVDLGAPGVTILSTLPGNAYGTANGTSMASPHVAGVAALVWSANPGLSAQKVKNAILSTVELLPALSGRTLTGGRLNAYGAVLAATPSAPVLPDRLAVALRADPGTVQRTTLGAAFPSPANPEVWIPYQLVSDADVIVTIFDSAGHPIRRLNVGEQRAGNYETRDTSAYWDGRNERGETVVSGTYFYRLDAGEFTATRKLLILR